MSQRLVSLALIGSIFGTVDSQIHSDLHSALQKESTCTATSPNSIIATDKINAPFFGSLD
jgi:hypothetical protein